MRRRKGYSKPRCHFSGCSSSTLAHDPFCRDHYHVLTRETREKLTATRKRGIHLLHAKHDDGKSLVEKACDEIEQRIQSGVRPGVRGVYRPAPRFLGNGRGDE